MFKQIIKHNNDAVALMKEARYMEAIQAFRHTLFVAKEGFEQISNSNLEQKQRVYDCTASEMFEWTAFSCYEKADDWAITFVYGRPVIVSPPFAETLPRHGDDLKHNEAEVAAGIMFNLALSLHLQSMELGANGIPLSVNALGMYQKVLQVLPESSVLGAVTHFNIGVIQQEHFHFASAKKSFDHSHIALQTDDVIEALYDSDRKRMALSIATFQQPHRAAAA